jgi:hypothetical protein
MTKTGAPHAKFFAVLIFILGFADGFSTFIIYMRGLPPTGHANAPMAFACVFLGIFTGTLIHELGHAAGALIAGWRVVVFAVRPFAMRFPNASFVLAGKKTFPGKLGFVMAVPGRLETLTPGRWACFIAAGPAASLFFAVYLGLGALALSHRVPTPTASFFAALCAGFALHSACVCLITLLPRGLPGSVSDGAKLLTACAAWHGIPEMDVLPWLLALLKHNIRPRDLPGWMVEATGSTGQYAMLHDTFIIARLLDARPLDSRQTRKKLDQFRAIYGATEWLCACDAYLAAIYEADPGRAAACLAMPQTQRLVPELTLAAQAALRARLGEEHAMKAYLSEMEQILFRGSPFRNDSYADIRRDVERVLQTTLRARAQGSVAAFLSAPGSVPYHSE